MKYLFIVFGGSSGSELEFSITNSIKFNNFNLTLYLFYLLIKYTSLINLKFNIIKILNS